MLKPTLSAVAVCATAALSLPAHAINIHPADAIAVFGSQQAAAIQASGMVRDSVFKHLNETVDHPRQDGGTLWFDAAAQHTRIDSADAGTGAARTRLYSASLGADIQTENILFGVAYSFGQSDTDADTLTTESTLDGEADHFGATVYAQTQAGPVRLDGSLGWMHLRGQAQFFSPYTSSVSVRSNTYWADLKASLPLTWGAVTLTPYAGIQATVLTPKNPPIDQQQTEHAMLYQFPIGLRLASVTSLGSVSIHPSLDLSAVTTLGDHRDLTVTVNGTNAYHVTLLDRTLWRAALGLTLVGDNSLLSLAYRYSYGSHDRDTHALLLTAKYLF